MSARDIGRLLIHDTLETAPFVYPLRAGWATVDVAIEARPGLRAADLGPDDVALLPSAEMAHLQETHNIVPDVAVVASGAGAVGMRVPARPDTIERSPVRLWETSGTAELLARATLHPFYGIRATAWSTDDLPDAQVVIVEGIEALRSPEAGYAEDLCRAWFILTGEPVVTHVLVAPRDRDRETLAPALAALETLRAAGHERRRDLRQDLAETQALERGRLAEFFSAQRLSLDEGDRRALLMLLQKGNRGSASPYVWQVSYLEPEE